MRARRREINIFNMSLLDILCGALGAFCFMMLVALPYYKPPGSDKRMREAQAETAQLMHDIEQMKDRMRDPQSAQELEALMRRLEAQVKALQGQVNILSAENETIKLEKEQLAAKNQELSVDNELQALRIKQKKLFMVVARADDPTTDLDLALRDDVLREGKKNVPFDPQKPHNGNFWSTDLAMHLPSYGIGIWVSSEALPESHHKIFVKLANDAEKRKDTGVSTDIFGDFVDPAANRTISIQLTRDRFWMLLGTLTVDANYKLSFVAATPAEREAEWSALMKNASAAPTATPSATSSAKSADVAQLRWDYQAKLERLHKLQAAPAHTAATEAEIATLVGELRVAAARLKENEPAESKASASPRR